MTDNEQNADVSKTLTEQWKKRALLSGWYWVKMSYQGAIIPLYYSEDYGFEYDDHFYDFEEISEVLGRVPSYELWKAVHEQWKVLLQENTKLKKLLKKHRDIFARTLALCIDLNFGEKQKNQFADDIAEIDQVLGEE